MRRKVIQQGLGGYTIYLPKRWVEENNIAPKTEIALVEDNNNLIISTDNTIKRKEKTIKLDSTSESFIKIMIHDLYRSDYDRIDVETDNKEAKEIIKSIVTNLLGFEITEETKKIIRIENIAEPSENKQEQLLKRSFYIIKDTLGIILEDIENNDFKSNSTISKNCKLLGSYSHFSRRCITKKIYQDNPFFHWQLYYTLNLITRGMIYLYSELKNSKTKTKNIQDSLRELIKYFSKVYQSFYKKDKESLNSVTDSLKKLLHEDIGRRFLKESKTSFLAYNFLGDLVRHTYQLIPSLLGLIENENHL